MAYYKEHVWAEVLFEVMACILREDDYKKVQKLLTASEAGELAGNLSDPIPKDWMLGIFGQLYPFMQLYNPPSWDKWDRFYEGLYPLMTAHLDLITENKDLNQYLPEAKSFGVGSRTTDWFDEFNIPKPKFPKVNTREKSLLFKFFVLPGILFGKDDDALENAFSSIESHYNEQNIMSVNSEINKLWGFDITFEQGKQKKSKSTSFLIMNPSGFWDWSEPGESLIITEAFGWVIKKMARDMGVDISEFDAIPL